MISFVHNKSSQIFLETYMNRGFTDLQFSQKQLFPLFPFPLLDRLSPNVPERVNVRVLFQEISRQRQDLIV